LKKVKRVEKKAVGRISKYEPKIHDNLAKWLARDGYNNEQIAARFEINPSTLQRWIKEYPNLKECLRKGKEEVRYEVEDTLIKRAMGYDYSKEEIEVHDDGFQKKKITSMHVAGDVNAIIFYLRTQWKEKYGDQLVDLTKQFGEAAAMTAKLEELAILEKQARDLNVGTTSG
jgi:transposase-like protein